MLTHPRLASPLVVKIVPLPFNLYLRDSDCGLCSSSSGSGVRMSRGVPQSRGDTEREYYRYMVFSTSLQIHPNANLLCQGSLSVTTRSMSEYRVTGEKSVKNRLQLYCSLSPFWLLGDLTRSCVRGYWYGRAGCRRPDGCCWTNGA